MRVIRPLEGVTVVIVGWFSLIRDQAIWPYADSPYTAVFFRGRQLLSIGGK